MGCVGRFAVLLAGVVSLVEAGPGPDAGLSSSSVDVTFKVDSAAPRRLSMSVASAVAQLNEGDETEQYEAASYLAEATARDAAKVLDADAVKPLASLLDDADTFTPDGRGKKLKATDALANLAVGRDGTAAVVDSGAIPSLLNFMNGSMWDPDRVESGARAVANVAKYLDADDKTTAKALRTGVESLVWKVRHGAEDAGGIQLEAEQAARAMAIVAGSPGGAAIVREAGAAEPLAKSLTQSTPGEQMAALDAIRVLASQDAGSRPVICNTEEFYMLPSFLFDRGVKQDKSLEALGDLTSHADCRAAILSGGYLEATVALLDDIGRNQAATKVIKNIALEPEGAKAVGRAGAVGDLVRLVRGDLHSNSKAGLWAAEALGNLGSSEEGRITVKFVGGAKALTELAKSGPKEHRQQASKALAALRLFDSDTPQVAGGGLATVACFSVSGLLAIVGLAAALRRSSGRLGSIEEAAHEVLAGEESDA